MNEKSMTFLKKKNQAKVHTQNLMPGLGTSKQSNSNIKVKAYDAKSDKFIEAQSSSPLLVARHDKNIPSKGKRKENSTYLYWVKTYKPVQELSPVIYSKRKKLIMGPKPY